jgi:hypothetical protein
VSYWEGLFFRIKQCLFSRIIELWPCCHALINYYSGADVLECDYIHTLKNLRRAAACLPLFNLAIPALGSGENTESVCHILSRPARARRDSRGKQMPTDRARKVVNYDKQAMGWRVWLISKFALQRISPPCKCNGEFLTLGTEPSIISMHIFFDDVGVIHWNWMRRIIATPRNRNEHMRPGVPSPNATHSTPSPFRRLLGSP